MRLCQLSLFIWDHQYHTTTSPLMARQTRSSAKAASTSTEINIQAVNINLGSDSTSQRQHLPTLSPPTPHTEDVSVGTPAQVTEPPKRKRGRPRKSDTAVSASDPTTMVSRPSRKKPEHAARKNLTSKAVADVPGSSIGINNTAITSHLDAVNGIQLPPSHSKSVEDPTSQFMDAQTLSSPEDDVDSPAHEENGFYHPYHTRPSNDPHPGVTAGLAPRSKAEISAEAERKRDEIQQKVEAKRKALEKQQRELDESMKELAAYEMNTCNEAMGWEEEVVGDQGMELDSDGMGNDSMQVDMPGIMGKITAVTPANQGTIAPKSQNVS